MYFNAAHSFPRSQKSVLYFNLELISTLIPHIVFPTYNHPPFSPLLQSSFVLLVLLNMKVECFFFFVDPLCFILPGLSPASALWGNSDPSRWGEAYNPEGQESATAPVWPAGLWVRPAHPGGQPPSHCPPLQQLQCTVPEQFGRLCGAFSHWDNMSAIDDV